VLVGGVVTVGLLAGALLASGPTVVPVLAGLPLVVGVGLDRLVRSDRSRPGLLWSIGIALGATGIAIVSVAFWSGDRRWVGLLPVLGVYAAVLLDAPRARAEFRSAAEADRHRLARDLHDTTSRDLFLAQLRLQAAERSILAGACAPPSATPGSEVALAEIRQAQNDVRRAINGMRSVVHGLRAPIVPGLPGMAAELAAGAQMLAAVGVRLVVDGAPAGDRDSTLRWAVREALTNVARHAAGARTCTVRFLQQRDSTVMEVCDDGTGTRAVVSGHGLTGIGERAEQVGGIATIVAGPRGGLCLRIVVPTCRDAPQTHPAARGRGR